MVYISKLEIRGFKSFASKVSLPLAPGLTAIVGPNGSGKSNIIEAILFVLGGLSAKTMRAERFSDLLFSGGNGCRPASFAEVALHFDNGDGAIPLSSKTVVISRRLERGGKCTYKLNKRRASRHEILELLAEAVGGPDGYNFIMQGDVDRFIKMSPLERREIIDGLAGVAEFDEKKRKSLAELERVGSNLKSLEAVLQEVKGQLERLEEDRRSAVLYNQLMSRLQLARATLLHHRRESLAKRLGRLKQRIGASQREVEELLEDQDAVRKRERELEEELEKVGQAEAKARSAEPLLAVERLKARVKTLDEVIGGLKREHEEVEIQELRPEGTRAFQRLVNIRRELVKLVEELKRLLPQEALEVLSRVEALVQELGLALEELKTELELQSPATELQSRREGLAQRLEELEHQMREAQCQLQAELKRGEELQKELEKVLKRKQKLQSSLQTLRRKKDRLNAKIQRAGGKLQELRVEEAKLQVQLEAVEKELRGMRARPRARKPFNPSKLQREIEELEAKLSSLGPINFRAAKEFTQVEKRYLAQREKYEKLLAERRALLEKIQEVETKKIEVFTQTFREVSKSFSEVFKELSPGGSARLVLENPENPFEGGLEIEARPGGKGLVKVEALSGGEKALTALAFIFALQRVKPSTFYVLDEIDAHLDEENLARVAQILRRLSRGSQIVVVTLRDQLMSVADRLFGVTMDERKVSNVVSVELKGLR